MRQIDSPFPDMRLLLRKIARLGSSFPHPAGPRAPLPGQHLHHHQRHLHQRRAERRLQLPVALPDHRRGRLPGPGADPLSSAGADFAHPLRPRRHPPGRRSSCPISAGKFSAPTAGCGLGPSASSRPSSPSSPSFSAWPGCSSPGEQIQHLSTVLIAVAVTAIPFHPRAEAAGPRHRLGLFPGLLRHAFRRRRAAPLHPHSAGAGRQRDRPGLLLDSCLGPAGAVPQAVSGQPDQNLLRSEPRSQGRRLADRPVDDRHRFRRHGRQGLAAGDAKTCSATCRKIPVTTI